MVITFRNDPKVYHYPPREGSKNEKGEATLCSIRPPKSNPPQIHETLDDSSYQPCDECSQIDDHLQRFVGTW